MLCNKKIFSTVITSLFIASCTITDPKTPKVSFDDNKGYYKVGEPYQIDGTWYYPKEQPDYDEVGISSWYGDEFHGKPTANGDVFNKNSLTAAHNTLPLPSMVRVTNLENNKTIILMVNDRGPFAKGRVIDVSERAADILGYKEKGIAKVRVQFLEGQTKRLLAGIKNAPAEALNNKEGFALFERAEKSPYAMDDGEFEDMEKDETPFGLSVDKNKILQPVKNLSNMLSNKQIKQRTPADLPEINISESEKSKAIQPIKPSEMVVENELDELKDNNSNDDFSEDLDINTIGSWQGDIDDEEIEQTIETVKESSMQISSEADKDIKKIPETKQHFVQAGTYSKVANAYRIEKKLMPLGDVLVVPVIIGDRTLYRVRLGPIPNEKIANIALQKVVNLGHPDAMIVKQLPSVQ
jgi:rare lipoprotein A